MKKTVFLFLMIFLAAMVIMTDIKKDSIQQSIVFFPLDENVSFTAAKTNLAIIQQNDKDEFTINWEVDSTLDQVAYLRQDISLLFEDGYLIERLGKWEKETDTLEERKKVKSEDSGHFESISFHHAEIHYASDIIKSKQTMTSDSLYVIDSPLAPLESFKTAKTDYEKEWKEVLDHAKNQHMHVVWKKLMNHYQIPDNKYIKIPFTSLPFYTDKPLPGMSKEKSDTAIGRLWERLYQNYFLGIRLNSEKTIPPEGSTMPLILLDQQATHVIILFNTKTKEPIQLLQYL